MNDNYYSIDNNLGYNIDDVVMNLQQENSKGRKVKTEFNGVWLYSDTVTFDSAYLQITGVTKKEFDKRAQFQREEYARKELEHKEKIPELTIHWIAEGNKVLTEDKQDLWAEVVPIRLDDLYRGMELKMTLDIVKILNTGGTFEEAEEELRKQGHSGMSHSLVCSMIAEFCERGTEFVNTVR